MSSSGSTLRPFDDPTMAKLVGNAIKGSNMSPLDAAEIKRAAQDVVKERTEKLLAEKREAYRKGKFPRNRECFCGSRKKFKKCCGR